MKTLESGVEEIWVKSGERRWLGGGGKTGGGLPPQTLTGHVQICLHPQSNEEKLEDFKNVSTQIRFELWEDHSNCSKVLKTSISDSGVDKTPWKTSQ